MRNDVTGKEKDYKKEKEQVRKDDHVRDVDDVWEHARVDDHVKDITAVTREWGNKHHCTTKKWVEVFFYSVSVTEATMCWFPDVTI